MTSNAIDYARAVSQAKLNESEMAVNQTKMDLNQAQAGKYRMEEKKIGSDIGSSGLKGISDLFGSIFKGVTAAALI